MADLIRTHHRPLRAHVTPLLLMGSGMLLLIALLPGESHALGVLTILGVILGGKMAKSGLDSSVDNATADVKDVVSHTTAQIDALIEQLETTYDGALYTTLDSLDGFAGQQMARLAGLFDQINGKMMDDWSVVQGDVLQLLQQVDGTIQQTLTRMEDLIVVGVRGVSFVIDKTTYNAAFILAIVLTAVGILMFVRLLWTAKRPDHGGVRLGALALMAVYLVFCAALLAPQARAYAITMVGQAKKLEQLGSGPHLFSMTPTRLIVGEPAELMLVGANFDAGDPPQVMVGARAVTPSSWSSDHIIVKLAGATTKTPGSQTVAVRTASGALSNGVVVHFEARPLAAKILSWMLTPTGQKADLTKNSDAQTLTINCKAGYGYISNSLEIKLEGDWFVDRDRPARFTDTGMSALLGAPGATGGYTETVLKPVGPNTYRTVAYLANDRGIKVSAKCAFFLPFKAKYVVHARKYVLRTGDAVSGGAVDITGAVKTVGKYPVDKLKSFKNKQPDQYLLRVQLRAPDGATVEKSQVFTPGSQTPLVFEGLAIWMENEAVKANRPGGSLVGPKTSPMSAAVLLNMQQSLQTELVKLKPFHASP